MVGDAPQAIIGNVSLADADSYFADRQAHGINAVWINLLCTTYTGCNGDGSTFDGIAPFTSPNDISTPNPVYFQKVDDVLNLAAQHGITVFLDPAETGGWLSFLGMNGAAKDEAYGEYLASRYKNFPNIVWLLGNDFQKVDWENPSADALVTAIADGLRAGGDQHLMTIELNPNESLSTDDPNWASRVDVNGAYSYYPTYDEILNGYNYKPTMPVVFLEGHYDGECVGPGGCGTPIVLRRQEYWTMTSGAAGQLYGTQYWGFQSGWQTGIDTTGADQLQIMADFFESLPWYNLVPNQDHSLVTAGYGTYDAGETGETDTDDYVTAAETPEGNTAVVYLSDTHTITVDIAKMSGTVTAQWFDPTTGRYSPAGTFANSGSDQFTSPAAHSDGTDDWVLLLQSGSQKGAA